MRSLHIIDRVSRRLRLSWVGFILASSGCADPRVSQANHVIDTCFPSSNVLSLAESRAKNFWSRHSNRFPDTKLLAVEGTTVSPDNDIYPKLLYSETGGVSVFARGIYADSDAELAIHCILIYDPQTGHLVSNTGYEVVDLPPRARVARFGPYMARYIGTGWDW
jgi:hypothetical protein